MNRNRIIVGVKYCFRYNARNRNLRMTGEDGEPINLENMPAHPRRRRREKKLMTIDEVNEKFPMKKYKSWVASRAHEGLPTQGGISQPPSRAGSIRDADGIIPLHKERDSIDETRTTGGASLTRSATRATHDEPTSEHTEKAEPTPEAKTEQQSTEGAAASTAAPARMNSPASDSDREEDDDQIHDALPPEALESSGDTCAICIDTLEDDDDVRGLTCGHAFHAVCLDPWLTSRRACCPLCKADYYTPKPRPPVPEGGAQNPEIGPTVSINQDPRTRMNMPSRPGMAWVFNHEGRVALPFFNRDRNTRPNQAVSSPRTPGSPRRSQNPGLIARATTAARADRSRTATNTPAAAENQNQTGGFFSNIRMPRLQLPGRSAPAANTTEVTPSTLEAGTHVDAAR